MMREGLDVTDAEFAVLEVLWDAGPQTIRELTERIYPSVSTSNYATIQKLLERLEAKRSVRRDRSGHRHVFEACRERSELVGSQLQKLANKLCAGSLTPMLLHLVQASKLTKSDRQLLRKMLDDDEKKSPLPARRKP
jgi:BlaI family transcriptional regulator, penicillinase repressor